MAKLATLYDLFDGTTLDTTKWTGTNVTVTSGEARLTGSTTSTAAVVANGLTTATTYDFVDSTFVFKLRKGTATNMYFKVGGTSGPAILIYTSGTDLRTAILNSGSISGQTARAYDATTMAYLRVRDDNTATGYVYVDRSADGTTWTNISSFTGTTTADAGWSPTAVKPYFWANGASTTYAYVDSVNPAAAPAPPPPVTLSIPVLMGFNISASNPTFTAVVVGPTPKTITVPVITNPNAVVNSTGLVAYTPPPSKTINVPVIKTRLQFLNWNGVNLLNPEGYLAISPIVNRRAFFQVKETAKTINIPVIRQQLSYLNWNGVAPAKQGWIEVPVIVNRRAFFQVKETSKYIYVPEIKTRVHYLNVNGSVPGEPGAPVPASAKTLNIPSMSLGAAHVTMYVAPLAPDASGTISVASILNSREATFVNPVRFEKFTPISGAPFSLDIDLETQSIVATVASNQIEVSIVTIKTLESSLV